MPNTRRPAAVVVSICAPWPASTRRPTPRADRSCTVLTRWARLLQLCVLRYPGRLLAPGEFVPPVVDFVGRQLHLDGEELGDYAVRSETRHEHLAELRRLYGFRSFFGRRGA